MKTYKEKLVAGLLSLGYERVAAQSRKYEVFRHAQHTKDGKDNFMFVGPSGALRQGRCSTESRSVGSPAIPSPLYTQLLVVGNEALKAQAERAGVV